MTEHVRKKKLIEVALPLDEINDACRADKDRKTGTIRNLHKWFAPMPLPAWRALLFAALIDDPEDDNRRVYLLDVIKRLVANGADLPDEETIVEAKALLAKQFPEGVPTVMDPFCGGGSTLVEAQRLGMPTYGSDLNPVPALITRTLTEILPKVYGGQPIHPREGARRENAGLFVQQAPFSGYAGLRHDVQVYAERIERQATERLKGFFPEIQTGESPIAWIWARTARCPNPACGINTVLTTSWWLSKRRGGLAWIEPSVENGEVHLRVLDRQRTGSAPLSPKAARGATFSCLGCGNALTETDLEAQAKAHGLGVRLTAVVAERDKKRIHRAPTEAESRAAMVDLTDFNPPTNVPVSDGGTRRRFGINSQSDLYSPRQLATLAVFSDLVAQTYEEVLKDGGSEEWATAVVTLLALAVGRLAMSNSSQARVTIRNDGTTTRFNAAFGRNDLPMTWDFPELNMLGPEGTWLSTLPTVLDALDYAVPGDGEVVRHDARTTRSPRPGLVATDPPYFDAIGYADLSDYFYVWHRRCLRNVHPDFYATVAAPKSGELTALPGHHGNSKETARTYFIEGFTETFKNLQDSLQDGLPMLVVYASKEQKSGAGEETRWSSILTAMVDADLEITGAWPVHGTGSTRMVGQGANAVASYIVMACRPRSGDSTVSLAEFNRILRRELGPAVRDLQAASILPVDLHQAALGPGMQIYSRYRGVLDQAGQNVPVGKALRLINTALGEVLDEQEGELDPDSRFAVRWWEAYGWSPAAFGEADKSARPLGISVDDVIRARVAESAGQKVRLLGNDDNLDPNWEPANDIRPTAWEAVHHLAHRLIDGGGELEASRLMAVLGNLQDPAMALTYRLHDIAAKKGRTGDQERYNALINSWVELVKLSADNSSMTEGLF